MKTKPTQYFNEKTHTAFLLPAGNIELDLLGELSEEISKQSSLLSPKILLRYADLRIDYILERIAHICYLSTYSFLIFLRRQLHSVKLQRSSSQFIATFTASTIDEYARKHKQSKSIEYSSEYLLFIRNGIFFLTQHAALTDWKEDHFYMIHSATKGEKGRYFIFPTSSRTHCAIADRIVHRLRSVSPIHLEASLRPTKRKISSVQGLFRYKGRTFYALRWPDSEDNTGLRCKKTAIDAVSCTVT